MAAPLFERSNRGLLLDLLVLGANLLGVFLLEGFFLDLMRQVAADDPGAMWTLFGCGVAMFVLPPVGATLKRWHYHQGLGGRKVDLLGGWTGCLFNPIFYFCLTVVLFSGISAFIMQELFGKNDPGAPMFVSSILIGIVLMLLHTFLVYRFFSAPKDPPTSAFMRGPASELIGDACLFVNMLMFQLMWNLLSFAGLGPPGGAVEFLGRLFVLTFLALLIYFPPRMFYLAEDAGKARTWLMILLANAPVIARVLLGSSAPAP